jgi:hypothetical protein
MLTGISGLSVRAAERIRSEAAAALHNIDVNGRAISVFRDAGRVETLAEQACGASGHTWGRHVGKESDSVGSKPLKSQGVWSCSKES